MYDNSEANKNYRVLSYDLVFTQVMRESRICKKFLENLLGIRVEHFEYRDKQKDLTDSIKAHGSRLDVFVKDSRGNAYNIEMQKDIVDALKKRARFYSAAIDRNMLKKGEDYANLRNTIVIFICNYDPFGAGVAEYVLEKYLSGPGTDVLLPYDDGAQCFYLNANYTINNVNAEITDFLNILRGNKVSTAFGRTVTERIDEVMSDEDTRRQIMTMEMRLNDERYRGKQEGLAEGRAEGLAEGREKAIRQSAAALQKLGMPMEQIAAVFEITVEELQKILQEPKKD